MVVTQRAYSTPTPILSNGLLCLSFCDPLRRGTGIGNSAYDSVGLV